jgi:hypothetical protein
MAGRRSQHHTLNGRFRAVATGTPGALILVANPDARSSPGSRSGSSWATCLRKAECAIRIFAPMPIKLRDQATDRDSDPTRLLFQVVSVFD